ncbi:RHS repeat domain-containing protein [Flavobacterium sp. HNIBRBA15423]|uniref:RHS repeat domain-containing protein n=1 Tax=Flavobacterium sp. HNIBRBA15423 TaxID=3458683 RepID=UPI004044A6BC
MNENSVITKTDYLAGGFQYKDNYLKFFPHPEGYVNVVDSHGINNYNYVFNYTDHLGNIRVSYGVDPDTQTLKILEENHYYPFGLKHEGYNMDYKTYQQILEESIKIKMASPVDAVYKYKYNGKELQDELGLNMYDYGARNYDPAIGRFSVPDPMQELYYGINSYAYVFNNPVQLVDPTGMIVEYADDPNKTKKENRQARREFKKSQRELNRKSTEARNNWRALKKSSNVHTIHINEKKSDGKLIENHTKPKDGYTKENGVGTDIYINTNSTSIEGEELGTNIIGISHEEGHAFRFDQGLVEENYEPNMSDPNDFNNSMLHISRVKLTEEVETSHIENIVRAQVDPTGQKIPLRKTYKNIRQHRVNPSSGMIEIYYKDANVVKAGYNYYKKTTK